MKKKAIDEHIEGGGVGENVAFHRDKRTFVGREIQHILAHRNKRQNALQHPNKLGSRFSFRFKQISPNTKKIFYKNMCNI